MGGGGYRRLAAVGMLVVVSGLVLTHFMIARATIVKSDAKQYIHQDKGEVVARSALEWAKKMREERDKALRETERLRAEIVAFEEKPLQSIPVVEVPKVGQDTLIAKEAAEATENKKVFSVKKEKSKEEVPIQESAIIQREVIRETTGLAVCYTLDSVQACVEPEIQYRKKTKVFLVPADRANAGWRFQHLIRQGFMKHPAIEPVDNMSRAEFVLYLSVSTAIPPPQAKKYQLVVLDESDGSGANRRVTEDSYLIYLKRSWVSKKDGVYTGLGRGYEKDYYPMAYSVSDDYFDPKNTKSGKERRLDIVCSNRPFDRQPTRARVVYWVADFLDRTTYKGIAGEVNNAGRREINTKYFAAMRSSKIVVTANPSHWEGDFRFFEAVASGALVFVDEMYAPHPHPFVHGKHLIVYDNSDQETFQNLLQYYLDHPEEAREIARAGLRHALRYHRALSRMDWILRSAAEIRSRKTNTNSTLPSYTHTARKIAFDLNSTTQVEPFVDIASPAVRRVDPKRNIGRRHQVTLRLEDADYRRLVKRNRERRAALPQFRRRRRRR